jgi:hypothetical protein
MPPTETVAEFLNCSANNRYGISPKSMVTKRFRLGEAAIDESVQRIKVSASRLFCHGRPPILTASQP